MFRLKNQELQISLEIKNAVRAVQTDYKRLHAYKIARELAEKASSDWNENGGIHKLHF
jgi:hypothetical protein